MCSHIVTHLQAQRHIWCIYASIGLVGSTKLCSWSRKPSSQPACSWEGDTYKLHILSAVFHDCHFVCCPKLCCDSFQSKCRSWRSPNSGIPYSSCPGQRKEQSPELAIAWSKEKVAAMTEQMEQINIHYWRRAFIRDVSHCTVLHFRHTIVTANAVLQNK